MLSTVHVSPRDSNNFSCEHVWEISLTLTKDHHEWLRLGRTLYLIDLLFPSTRLCLLLYSKFIPRFQLCLDVICFRLFR